MAWTEKQRKAHSARMKKIWAGKRKHEPPELETVARSLRAVEVASLAHRSLVEDMVGAPPHYRKHPSGIECIEVTEHMNFCRGNAIKYIWRAGEKGSEVEDLRKAVWYINREIERIENA